MQQVHMPPTTRRWLLMAYLAVLVELIAGSTPRIVGDAPEYLGMALHIGAPGWPAPSSHFWFYSALAAPWVRLADLIGLNALVGFTALNLLLLGGAFWVVSARLEWPFTLLLFIGPIIWWVDKAHTEVFSFSLLAIALTLMREAPWWSMVCLGAASTQNPPFALLLPMVGLLALATNRGGRDRRI